MSTSRKHVTSSLSCRHLPNIGGTTGLTLTAKAYDGAVEFRRSLPAVGRSDAPPSSDGCFDWQLPVGEFTSGSSRTRFAHVGDATTLNFSFLFLCNKSLDAIRLSWRGDLPAANSSASFYAVDLLSPASNSTGSSRCSEPGYAHNVSDDVTVTCHGVPLSPDDGGCAYYVDVELPVVGRHHAGAYSFEFVSRDQSVSYHVELVVLDRGTSAGADELVVLDRGTSGAGELDRGTSRADKLEVLDRGTSAGAGDSAPFRLRLRTCGNATWVGAGDGTAATTEYRLRQLVPDCVRCEASGSAAVDVQLLRSDGLILGSEDAHSVYWYRDGARAHAVVLVLRAPSDDYSADYYCVASASGSLRPAADDARKRHPSRKYVRSIRFRLTVQ